MGERQQVTIYYDGQCPFCTRYTDFLRLKSEYDVALRDARSGGAPGGFDLDEGMLVVTPDATYHGAEAMRVLALMSEGNTLLRKFYKAVFSSPERAGILYPVLRAGRNLTLWLLGRRRINANRP